MYLQASWDNNHVKLAQYNRCKRTRCKWTADLFRREHGFTSAVANARTYRSLKHFLKRNRETISFLSIQMKPQNWLFFLVKFPQTNRSLMTFKSMKTDCAVCCSFVIKISAKLSFYLQAFHSTNNRRLTKCNSNSTLKTHSKTATTAGVDTAVLIKIITPPAAMVHC